MALAQRSIMSEAAGSESQSHKKRKLDHRVIAMGEQTEQFAAANTNGAARSARDVTDVGHGLPAGDADPKQRVLQLLAPFTREQLLEILTSAATQHDDVLLEIKAIASADVAHRKVFVRGLAWETTTEGLTEAFEAFGQVEEGAVIYDKATGKSRGFGFVTFVEIDGAQRAIEKQAIEIDGRRATCNLAAVRAQSDDHQHQQPHYGTPGTHVPVQYTSHGSHVHHPPHTHVHTHAQAMPHPARPGAPPAASTPYTVYTTSMQPPPQAAVYAVPAGAPPPTVMEPPHGASTNQNDEPERKLFVRGLSWDTTDDSLRAEFIKFGELVEASVVRERKTGKSKGFGFVTFRHRGAAAAALQQPHKVIDGRSVTCNLASLGRTAPPAAGVQYMAPAATYVPPQQPDMGGYAMYAQPPPPTMAPAVDPYRQHQHAHPHAHPHPHPHPQYAYGGAPPPLPPAQQYYYAPAPQGHPAPQGRR